jgi:hypothetical protein
VEVAPAMQRAFAADRVDLSILGDWEDVQVELGLKATRETPRTYRPLFPLFDAPERDESHRGGNTEKAAAKKQKAKRKQAKASRKKNRKRK